MQRAVTTSSCWAWLVVLVLHWPSVGKAVPLAENIFFNTADTGTAAEAVVDDGTVPVATTSEDSGSLQEAFIPGRATARASFGQVGVLASGAGAEATAAFTDEITVTGLDPLFSTELVGPGILALEFGVDGRFFLNGGLFTIHMRAPDIVAVDFGDLPAAGDGVGESFLDASEFSLPETFVPPPAFDPSAPLLPPTAQFVEGQLTGNLGTLVDTTVRIEFLMEFGTPFLFNVTSAAASTFEGTVDFDNTAQLTGVSVASFTGGTLTPLSNFGVTGSSGGTARNYVQIAQANTTTAVPEPGTLGLFAAALSSVAWAGYRRRHNRA